MSFYNTIELKDHELTKARVRAKSQEEEIYALMLRGGEWTATRLNTFFPLMIKTSIRRSLTDLDKAGKIEWIDWVPGPNGRDEGLYKVKKQLKMF